MAVVAVTSANTNKLGTGRNIVRTSAGVPYIVLEDTTDGGIEVCRGGTDFYLDADQKASLRTSGTSRKYGQTFTCTGGTINGASFKCEKVGSPTGTIVAKLYNMTGTYGSSGIPTGDPLAISNSIDISTIGTPEYWLEFTFPTPYSAASGYYCITIEPTYTSDDVDNNITVGRDVSSPTHSGNAIYMPSSSSTWSASSAVDTAFQVIGTSYIFAEQNSAANPQSSGRYGNPACAIDANNIIHIIYADDNAGTPIYRYVTFNTGTGAFAGDAALTGDLGADMTSVNNMHCAIAVDANNIPHVAYVGYPANMGTNYYTVYYNNRVGGAWNTSPGLEIEGATASRQCRYPQITIDADTKPCISYINETDNDVGTGIGNANDASTFTMYDVDADNETTTATNVSSIAVDSSGNHYVAYRDESDTYIYINKHVRADGWTTWQTRQTNSNNGINPSLAINTADIYIFYEEDTAHDIVYDKYSGTWGSGTWEGESSPALEGGTFNTVKARWSYLNNPSYATYGIDYVFVDETATPDVQFNTLSLGAALTKALADTVNLSMGRVSSIGKRNSDTVNLSASFSRVVTFVRTYADTTNLSDALTKSLSITKADAVNLSDNIELLISLLLSLSDNLTLADAITKSIGQIQADNIVVSDANIKTIGALRADAITLSDAITKAISTILADNAALSDAIIKAVDISESDNISLTDALVKTIGQALSDNINLSDVITKGFTSLRSDTVILSDLFTAIISLLLSLADNVTLSDSQTKSVNQALADNITLADLFSRVATYLRTIADNLTVSDDNTKSVSITKSDSVTLADSVTKTIQAIRADNITLSDDILKSLSITQADAIIMADACLKSIAVAQADGVDLTDTLIKAIGLSQSDNINLSDLTAKYYELVQADNISLSDVIDLVLISAGLLLSLSDSISLSDQRTVNVSNILSDNLSLSDAAIKSFQIALSDSANLSDIISKLAAILIADGITLSELIDLDLILSGLTLLLSDSVTLSDLQTKDLNITEADIITITDAISKLNYLRTHPRRGLFRTHGL